MRGKTFASSLALVAGIALAGVGVPAPAQAGDLKVDVHLGHPHGYRHYGHHHGHTRWHYFKRHHRRHFGHHPWPHRYRHYGHSQKRGYRSHRPRHWGGYGGRSNFGLAMATPERGSRHGVTTRMR